MSLCLATKGKVAGALPHATSGVICTLGRAFITELSIIPELIFRRAEMVRVYAHAVVGRIFKRDGIDEDS